MAVTDLPIAPSVRPREPLTRAVLRRDQVRRRLDDLLVDARHGDVRVAVVMLELAGLRGVNDAFGYPVGDAVVATVTRRLLALVGPDDLVARVRGDQFMLVLPGRTTSRAADLDVARVCDAAGRLVDVDGLAVPVGLVVGTALAQPWNTAADVIRNACDVLQGQPRSVAVSVTLPSHEHERLRG